MRFREFTLADSARVASLLNDIEVSKWTSQIPYPYSKKDADAWIASQAEKGSGKAFAIELSGDLVGCISYWPYDDGAVEIGYWLGREFWGQGIVTKALSALLGSSVFPAIPKVVAKVADENIGSHKVLEKCGFIPVKPCQVIKQGKAIGALVYHKLR